jgi:hypothetical protein
MLGLARILLISGVVLILLGGLVYLAGRVGLPLGRLPGDIRIQGENVTCLIPLATSILLSIVLTLVLNIVARLLNR